MMGMLQRQMIQAVVLALAGMLPMMALPQTLADDIACNSTIKNATGEISMPTTKAPGPCTIKIERQDSETNNFTTIQFSSVVMLGNDSMVIYDGDGSDPASQNVTKITAGTAQGPFSVVTWSKVTAIFIDVTDAHTKSTFEAMFSTSACTIGQEVAIGALVQSPLYKPGGGDFKCSYAYSRTDNSSNTQFALTFSSVNMPKAMLTFSFPTSLNPVKGTEVPFDVYTQGNISMELTVPKGNTTVEGFSGSLALVTYSVACGKNTTITSSQEFKLIVPSNHPMPYDCRVTLKAAKGKSLLLKSTSLQLSTGGDRLIIVDGPSYGGGRVLASLSQATPGYMVLSSKQQMTVRLVVDQIVGQRSFVAMVTELGTVGHLFDAGSFNITPQSDSNGFPQTQYYLMEAAAGKKVVFNLGTTEAGKKDNFSVDVRDGCQTTSPLLINVRPEQSARFPLTSSDNKLLVVATFFNASGGLSNSTFTYTDTPACGQVTSSNAGYFKLPLSPVPDTCTWTITNVKGTGMLFFPLIKLTGNASVTVYNSVGGNKAAVFTASNTKPTDVVPHIAFSDTSSWPQIVFSAAGANGTTMALETQFHFEGPLCGGQISDTHGHLLSPLYPNLYPLNILCKWTFPGLSQDLPKDRLLFFSFGHFQLAQNHSLTISEMVNTSAKTVGKYGGAKPVPSLLYASSNVNEVTFNAEPSSAAASTEVSQGLDVEYWVLNCGGNLTEANKTLSSPGYPSLIKASNKTLCAWTVTVPATNPSSAGSVNIVQMNFKFKTTGSVSVKDVVKVYDGNMMSSPPLVYDSKTGSTSYSLYNFIIVVFNASALSTADAGLAFEVNFTPYMCDKSNLCDNRLCIHPGWRCNGIDDCGDDTDEKNCSVPPASKTGVKPAVVAVLFFLGLLIGVLGAVCIPRIIRRVRSNRYTAFHNEPALA